MSRGLRRPGVRGSQRYRNGTGPEARNPRCMIRCMIRCEKEEKEKEKEEEEKEE